MDDIYVLGKLDILGIDCALRPACQTAGRLHPLFKRDSLSPMV